MMGVPVALLQAPRYASPGKDAPEERYRYHRHHRWQRGPGVPTALAASEEPSDPREWSGCQRTAALWVLGEGSAPEVGQEREWEMGTIRLEHVLAEVKLLSQEEQQQLRDTLDRWLRHDQPADRLEDVLVEAGLLRARRPRGEETAPLTAFTPVVVRGQPVSETLIEERR